LCAIEHTGGTGLSTHAQLVRLLVTETRERRERSTRVLSSD